VPHREISDVVIKRGEPYGQVTEPPFHASDRMRKQVVVDETDAHC
jgi:hypothetical protein